MTNKRILKFGVWTITIDEGNQENPNPTITLQNNTSKQRVYLQKDDDDIWISESSRKPYIPYRMHIEWAGRGIH